MNKYVLVLNLILFFACNNENKIRKGEILKEKDFIDILIDIHKADGIIEFKNLQSVRNHTDSISLYNYVLKKHNVSREKFRKTVDYYAVHNEEYINIYKTVQSYFNKQIKELQILADKDRQEELKKEKLKDTTELWNLKKEWNLPEDGKKNPIPFKIDIQKQGTYILSARIKFFPDDYSVKQRMTIIANYFDGTKDVNSNGTMVKDGRFDNFDVSVKVNPKKKLKYISGWLLDHSEGTKSKHAQVRNISLKRINNEVIINEKTKQKNSKMIK